MMTIDKIKFYMDPVIFIFWVSCTCIETIERAKNELENEINTGILTDVKYFAELNLLKYLLN